MERAERGGGNSEVLGCVLGWIFLRSISGLTSPIIPASACAVNRLNLTRPNLLRFRILRLQYPCACALLTWYGLAALAAEIVLICDG